ncbi:MAG TPA: STAS domain-containing protein [Candidatus Polarisedimenticolaceae bacterium]|nr:STAS domain-containing protein [Candidatus Polarisedimenticolaceae bacterium]
MLLRISRDPNPSPGVRLKAEGRLIASFAALVEDEGRAALAAADTVVLDLSGVSVVDRAGLEALSRLDRAGVTITGCSEIVASILAAEGIRTA